MAKKATIADIIEETESQTSVEISDAEQDIETAEPLTAGDGTEVEETVEETVEAEPEKPVETPVEKLVKMGAKRKDKSVHIDLTIENKVDLLEEYRAEHITLQKAQIVFKKTQANFNSLKKKTELSIEELDTIIEQGGGMRTVSSWEIEGFKLLSQFTVSEIEELGLKDEDSTNMIVLSRDGKIIDRYGLSDEDLQLEIEWSRKEDVSILKAVVTSSQESEFPEIEVPENASDSETQTTDEVIEEVFEQNSNE